MLSEKSKSQKDKYHMSLFIWGTESSQNQRKRVEWQFLGAGELVFIGHRASVEEHRKRSGDKWWWWVHNNTNVLKAIELYN